MTSSEPNPIDMKKLLLCALALISVISCGPKRQKSANLSLNELVKEALTKLSDSDRKKTVTVKPELVYPEQGIFATEGRYLFFGQIGFEDRSFQEDTLLFPPIEGLVHGSAYALCPKDTCFAEYTVLALRCPPVQPLLNWVADTVNTFVQGCPIGNGLLTYNEKQLDIPVKHLKSDKAICDYNIGQLQHVYNDWHCTGEGDHDILNEQAGLLLADCWHTGNLYTFYRIDWYDWMSGGNNARESWWTVDATSGRLLTLDDMIRPEMKDSLSTLMMERLVNGIDDLVVMRYPFEPADYPDVLQRANGCALIPEGLVIYFYPYNLGSGADGEFEAVIPYEELNGILREPLSTVLVPLSQEENIDPHDYRRKDGRPHIDLFGVDLVGTPKRILHKLNKNPIVQIDLGQEGFLNEVGDKVTCRVLIGGHPFGMNLTFGEGEPEIIKEVMFVTSETNWAVMAKLTKILSEYYGQPESVDYSENRYSWNSNGYTIIARPLHGKDSGWTFYIY
ncbi:MAG: DUF3298 domain-containing protein [Bacteroidales bacterium]|nr:DUF3298 domain-containing protein [Bacteroidales bacterium]